MLARSATEHIFNDPSVRALETASPPSRTVGWSASIEQQLRQGAGQDAAGRDDIHAAGRLSISLVPHRTSLATRTAVLIASDAAACPLHEGTWRKPSASGVHKWDVMLRAHLLPTFGALRMDAIERAHVKVFRTSSPCPSRPARSLRGRPQHTSGRPPGDPAHLERRL